MNNQDFEKESEKDFIYLHEEQQLVEQEYWEWYKQQHKKPAKIYVINQIETLDYEHFVGDTLPF